MAERVAEVGFEVFERYRPLIDDWTTFCEALSRPLPTCVWANTLRISPEALAEHMAATGLVARPLSWFPGAFRLDDDSPGARFEYVTGLYHVQEEVSLLPPVLLEARPGERVLDLCAAPGGKTAQIAVAMDNRGTVVANDRDFARLTTLRSTLDRLGAVNVSTTEYDGANLPLRAGLFDRVLADVPCSCEGTSRKNPEVLGKIGPESSRQLQGIQQALLRKAIQMVRRGGRIVYSTCTYAPEENEEVVAALLAENPGALRLVSVEVPGLRTVPGLTAWGDRRFPGEMDRALRVWPHHNDTGGFFVAVLEKTRAVGSEPDEAPLVAEHPGLEPAAAGRWREYLEERFGLNSQAFEKLHVFRRNRRLLGAVAADHRPPVRPRPQSVGMPLLYPEMRFPKPTTAGARLLAPEVRRGAVETDAAQADAYLRRRSFRLDAEQRQALAGPGFVLVRHAGAALGLGLAYRSEEDRDEELAVESLFPKRWAEAAPGEAFPGLWKEADRQLRAGADRP